MDQLWVSEVRLAQTVHYNDLEISSWAFFSVFKYSLKCLKDMFFHWENKTACVSEHSKYRMMLNIETLEGVLIHDVIAN